MNPRRQLSGNCTLGNSNLCIDVLHVNKFFNNYLVSGLVTVADTVMIYLSVVCYKVK